MGVPPGGVYCSAGGGLGRGGGGGGAGPRVGQGERSERCSRECGPCWWRQKKARKRSNGAALRPCLGPGRLEKACCLKDGSWGSRDWQMRGPCWSDRHLPTSPSCAPRLPEVRPPPGLDALHAGAVGPGGGFLAWPQHYCKLASSCCCRQLVNPPRARPFCSSRRPTRPAATGTCSSATRARWRTGCSRRTSRPLTTLRKTCSSRRCAAS